MNSPIPGAVGDDQGPAKAAVVAAAPADVQAAFLAHLWGVGLPPPVEYVDVIKGGERVSVLHPRCTAALFAQFMVGQRRQCLEHVAALALRAYRQTTYAEPCDLVHELYSRYSDGRRTYQRAHWDEDRECDPWLMFVFARLVGLNRKNPSAVPMGALSSLAVDARKRDRAVADDSIDVDNLVQFTSDDDSLAAAIHVGMIDALRAAAAAVEYCAKRRAFGEESDRAPAVFHMLYADRRNRSCRAIARELQVSIDLVALIADADCLYQVLQRDCDPRVLSRISDAITIHRQQAGQPRSQHGDEDD